MRNPPENPFLPKQHEAAADDPPLPSQGARTAISLLLVIHLFAAFVALSSFFSPSNLQDRLRAIFVGTYGELLNFDLSYRVTNSAKNGAEYALSGARFYLTRGERDDSEGVVEIETNDDSGSNKQTVPLVDPQTQSGKSHHRHLVLARVVARLADPRFEESADLNGALPRALGRPVKTDHEVSKATFRCWRHQIQQMPAIGQRGPDGNPYSAQYYESVLEATLYLEPDRVTYQKTPPAGQGAEVRDFPSGLPRKPDRQMKSKTKSAAPSKSPPEKATTLPATRPRE